MLRKLDNNVEIEVSNEQPAEVQPTKKLWHQSDLAAQQPGKVTVFTYYVTVQEVLLNKDGKTILQQSISMRHYCNI